MHFPGARPATLRQIKTDPYGKIKEDLQFRLEYALSSGSDLSFRSSVLPSALKFRKTRTRKPQATLGSHLTV